MKAHEKRAFKKQLYEQFARIGKALANAHRLKLLDVLAQCERSVEDLAQETGLSIANTSQHLWVLSAVHLVDVRRAGVSIYYRLTDESMFALRRAGETHLAEVGQVAHLFLQERESSRSTGAEALFQELTEQHILLPNVRPPEE